jgi:hypothetical protein
VNPNSISAVTVSDTSNECSMLELIRNLYDLSILPTNRSIVYGTCSICVYEQNKHIATPCNNLDTSEGIKKKTLFNC